MIPRYEMLRQDDIQRIHDATVEVLSEVGVKVYHDEALGFSPMLAPRSRRLRSQ